MVGDGDNGHFNPIAKFQLDVTKPSTDKIFFNQRFNIVGAVMLNSNRSSSAYL